MKSLLDRLKEAGDLVRAEDAPFPTNTDGAFVNPTRVPGNFPSPRPSPRRPPDEASSKTSKSSGGPSG